MQSQVSRKVNHAGRTLTDTGELQGVTLTIDEFDQWTNPVGLRLGGTIWTKTDVLEDAA